MYFTALRFNINLINFLLIYWITKFIYWIIVNMIQVFHYVLWHVLNLSKNFNSNSLLNSKHSRNISIWFSYKQIKIYLFILFIYKMFIMCFVMSSQIIFLSKAFATKLAFIWFFSLMFHYMIFQRRQTRVFHITFRPRTDVLFLLRVNQLMFL